MRFFDNLLKNIDIAILESIVTFGNNEGRFSREISMYYDKYKKSNDVNEQIKIAHQYLNPFENFAKVFRIIRNIDSNTSNRYKLINLLFEEYIPAIDKEYSPLSIDIYSEKANQLRLTHGKATSAFSKIAFLYKPNLYFPYDSTAKDSLKEYIREKRLQISLDRNYLNYSKAISLAFSEFNQCHQVKDYIINKKFLTKFRLNKNLLTIRMNNFCETCKLLNIDDIDDFIYRRTFDKALMIYGGFNRSNLVIFTDGIIE